ncbi:MAG: hypothetical protein V7631_1762 [Massilia sp.]|jgi:predicted porin
MKKTTFALALLGMAAGAASAQSAVTVYGLLDTAVVHEGGGRNGSVTRISSGVGAGSRLGFKGSEDLGGGLSAVFLLESGFQGDTGEMGQGGLLFGRQVYVGLQGRFGAVTVGRQYTPQYMTVVMGDPFGSGYSGDTKNIMATTGNSFSRMDNTVKYVSPSLKGVVLELVAAPGEVGGDSAAGRQLGAAIDYTAGPLRLRFGYHDRNNDTATLKGTRNGRNLVLAAVYDFKVVKAHLAYGTNRGVNSSVLRNNANPFGYASTPVPSTDSKDFLAGITVPFGPHALLASYIRKDDRTFRNQDARQMAVGYRYGLPKRTELYASYARIDNRNGASYTVGSAIESGTGNRAASAGIRHAF